MQRHANDVSETAQGGQEEAETQVQAPAQSAEGPGQSGLEAETSSARPYEGCVFVLTGIFPCGSFMAEKMVKTLGGLVSQSVSGLTTHLLLGASGTTEYGQATGRGSKKYKDAKKKRRIQIVEFDTFHASYQSMAEQKAPKSCLETEWQDLLAVIREVCLLCRGRSQSPPPRC